MATYGNVLVVASQGCIVSNPKRQRTHVHMRPQHYLSWFERKRKRECTDTEARTAVPLTIVGELEVISRRSYSLLRDVGDSAYWLVAPVVYGVLRQCRRQFQLRHGNNASLG